ncbi:MAG TPA: S24 family peptidase [Candidatus Paceibacterota bacterium]
MPHERTESRKAKLLSFYKKHRRMPNISEMMELFALSSRSSAFYASERLVEEGYANKDRTGKLVPAPGLFAIPRVGRIRAGFAAPAEEELADTVSIGEYLIDNPNASYLLTVEGDSMEGAGIRDGDMVIFERTHDVKPGQIVVALTEDGYTLKYLRKRGSRFYLEAANERYPDMYPTEGQIIGRVTSSFRTYG